MIYLLTNFIIGSCLASHAAVICEHYNQSDFIFTRSHCTICHSELSLLDELPIISYIFLRGRCRYCHGQISAHLFLIEVIGGFAYIQIDFSKVEGQLTAILIFSLLLVAIYDATHSEFHLVMLLPALFSISYHINNLFKAELLDYIEAFPILILLVIYIFQKKLGSGDLIIYLILILYFNAHFANQVFLFGSIFLLSQFILEKKNFSKKQAIPFIPYLFLGLVIQLILN
ncbi:MULTISPECIES: A24 family peptidase [unclassified Lactobacillus]|uniref:prepilin peptidase n=1 Tax=unclassified Lactobacillus TaxID=2620435 RepID=UPI000EFBF984|nr:MULTISPECIES: A24 family peptidase [unclassified Lactobacillus]RMC38496.1 prepilin peptidase [Lactobacillus sp. ESL0237]RMC42842.1 prepilin peptidase [Lactobacillus sp. ESL0234]RMC43696.1 prepilin peptidase [Lactobacillus sp. ESL0236]RMC44705.1 prepilin peptidase [Lactobacillus sp. ESL0230]RMC47946.1 prepilin peptidase [Lactobacillus sp. ESL0225]